MESNEKINIIKRKDYNDLRLEIRSSNDFQVCKKFIDIEEILFSENSTKTKEELYKDILTVLNDNKNDNFLLEYVIGILLYYIQIRPKSTDIPCFILSSLINSNFENKKDFIQNLISYKTNTQKDVQSVLFSEGIINRITTFIRTDTAIYEKGSIKYILQHDDLNGLQEFLKLNPSFFNKSTKSHKAGWASSTATKTTKATFTKCNSDTSFNSLDFCCLYGSAECFKFLLQNGYKCSKNAPELSICGGNLEILEILDQSGASFDNLICKSIQYHHKNITEILYSNFKFEIFSLTHCLEYFDYEAFLIFLHQGIGVNYGEKSPLNFICEQCIVDLNLVQLLLNYGADVNKEFKGYRTMTPLGYLCSKDTINLEAIKLLVNKGADVNNGEITPIFSLVAHNIIDQNIYEAMKLLISKGADLNKTSIKLGKYTPLSYLCNQQNINLHLLKFLIENGADVNHGNIPSLTYLCQHYDINYEAFQILLDHGADINKGSVTPLKLALTITCKQESRFFHHFIRHKEINNDLVKFLIEKGSDVNQEFEYDGVICTPLAFLCKQDKTNIELIKYFIEHGADINKGNNPPFQWLCLQKEPNFELIKYFIDNGADPNKGNSPPLVVLYHHATNDHELFNCIQYLLDHGADINIEFTYKNDYRYYTPLMDLCNKSKINDKLIKFFISHGADVNKGCITPLAYLCEKKKENYQLIKYFIEHGADLNKGSITPLDILCNNKKIDHF